MRAKHWSTLLVTPGEHPMRECADRLAVSFDESGGPTELATLPAATAPRGGLDPEVEFNPNLSFSSDGHTLATIGGDNTARLWDLRDPSHPAEIAALTGPATVRAVRFSPDGHTLVTIATTIRSTGGRPISSSSSRTSARSPIPGSPRPNGPSTCPG